MPPEKSAELSLPHPDIIPISQPLLQLLPPEELQQRTIPIAVRRVEIYQSKRPSRREKARAKQEQLRQEFLQLTQAYTIKRAERERREVTVQNKTSVEEGLYCETEGGHELYFVPPLEKDKIQLETEPYILNGAREELENRQNFLIPDNQNDRLHRDYVLFCYRNWSEILVHEFYSGQIIVNDTLFCVAEANFNDYQVIYQNKKTKPRLCGQIDMAGFGPDNQAALLEIGIWDGAKKNQTERQAIGLDAVMKKTNHDLPTPPVHKFVVEHDINDNTHILIARNARRKLLLPQITEAEH